MWMMLQQDVPGDYVIATGKSHTVGAFLRAAFERADLNPYYDENDESRVEYDEQYNRPHEVDCLLGCADKAYRVLGWAPKTGFAELVHMMVDSDIELAKREARMKGNDDAERGETSLSVQ